MSLLKDIIDEIAEEYEKSEPPTYDRIHHIPFILFQTMICLILLEVLQVGSMENKCHMTRLILERMMWMNEVVTIQAQDVESPKDGKLDEAELTNQHTFMENQVFSHLMCLNVKNVN